MIHTHIHIFHLFICLYVYLPTYLFIYLFVFIRVQPSLPSLTHKHAGLNPTIHKSKQTHKHTKCINNPSPSLASLSPACKIATSSLAVIYLPPVMMMMTFRSSDDLESWLFSSTIKPEAPILCSRAGSSADKWPLSDKVRLDSCDVSLCPLMAAEF